MTRPFYPHDRVDDVLAQVTLPPSYRIIPRRYLEKPLGTAPGDSRFCAKTDGYTVLYTSPDFATAFLETVVRDRFTHKRQREIQLKEVTGRAWVLIKAKPRTRLRVLDLRKDGCVRLGAPSDATGARNHAAGRALGQAIHGTHKNIDGLLFSSRLTGADIYVVFDRALHKLDIADTGALPDHPDLPDLLAEHGIQLSVL